MKRRNFFMGVAAYLIQLKSSVFFKSSHNGNLNSNSEEQLVELMSGSKYSLPANPEVGTKVSFTCIGDLSLHPAKINRNGNLLFGSKENLEIDLNHKFTLYYSGKEKGWIFS